MHNSYHIGSLKWRRCGYITPNREGGAIKAEQIKAKWEASLGPIKLIH